ncbi:MAG: hypothetical protein JSV99_06100 [Planctomycetota bacterium]|nr:MAG: hypothetical protein JSV99_06100 [Planctomycetota bacterium]
MHLFAAALIVGGCAPELKLADRICPGKQTVVQSLDVLNAHSENAVPLRANGQCRLRYYADGKEHKENFPVKLWVNPPAEMYLQGDVAFDAKGIVLGSNKDEFWLAMKPKEISGYWWGRWSDAKGPETLMISPKLLLDGLGIVTVDTDEGSWRLSNEGGFDVLAAHSNQGVVEKRIYADCCDYMVAKIEYFDANGQAVALVELSKYKEILEGFFVPSGIKITTYGEQAAEDSVEVTFSLSSIKPASFTDRQRDRLFTRPEPRGFEHIYKIVDGKMIEQPK